MKAMTKMLRRAHRLQALILVALTPGLILLPQAARSNPTGATVVHGGIVIDDLTPGHLKIQQSSNKAIINWQDFSIGAGELTQFIQPGKDAVALNRVVSGNPSTILGTLQANGGVILVNQNGILVGSGGMVDIGGLAVLSTLDISDGDFLDGGSMTFKGSSTAAVTNLGTITSRGGDVVLLANMVDNSGTVGAPDGTVAFGAGGEFVVDTIGDSRISVVGPGSGGQTGIKNTGTVTGASVEFKAHGNVYALAIQNTGLVRANGASRRNGRVILSAAGNGTTGGTIENTGTIEANNRDGSGGEILIDGGVGGTVNLVDGRVAADGRGNRNGGTVTVLGDVVNVMGGTVSANGASGGFVQLGSPESTTAITVGPNAKVSANGSVGNGGTVQLMGNGSSVVNVQGQVTANGAQAGGTVLMQGGTVTTAAGSTVSANGGNAGGRVNFIGNAVNVNGAVSATGANATGGSVLINGNEVSVGATGGIDVSSQGVGGMNQINADRVNIDGAIDARGANGAGGRVIIQGNGGGVNVGEDAGVNASGASGGTILLDSAGTTTMSGDLSATGLNGLGGRITTTGDQVIIGSAADINASGRNGGGEVNIGGSYQGRNRSIRNSSSTVVQDGARVKVDAMEGGNGGNAVVWSNGSTFYRGDISAQAFGATGNGGFVEVSGKEDLEVGGMVSTLAANGQNGVFLIDPVDVTVGAGSGTISDAVLVSFLALNNIIVHTGGGVGGVGDITIGAGANVLYDSPNSLTFLAHNNIFVNGDIKNHGMTDAGRTGNITLVAGWDGTLPAGLPNPGNPQALSSYVSAADFIAPDGTPIVGQFGNWGAAGSRIMFNDANLEPVEVGSARGQTNLFADSVLIKGGDSGGEFSQVGYRRTTDLRDTSFFGALAIPNGTVVNAADPAVIAARAHAASQIVDGDINVSGKTVVAVYVDPQSNTTDGVKTVNRVYTMIGHGGMREDDDDMDNRGGTDFGSDSGQVLAGDGANSGNITVYGGSAVIVQAGRQETFAQIGHGGYADDAPNASASQQYFVNTPATRGDGAVLGLNNIIGDMSGNITITAGALEVEAGLYDQAFAQIGHGGIRIRGEHSGDINITTTLGDVKATAAPDLVGAGSKTNFADGAWDNERGFSYVQVGHGGVDSDHLMALPARAGLQILQPDGTFVASTTATATSNPGDGIAINPATGRAYGHNGNINVIGAGKVAFTASGDNGYAMLGHGGNLTSGDHYGDINVEARAGGVIFDRIAAQVDQRGADRRQVGDRAFVQLGHGGYASNGGMTGDISVSATGNVEFYGGRNQSFAMIGHGGLADTGTSTVGGQGTLKGPNQAQGTHTGDITVNAGGDIKFRSGFGFGNLAFSMIGHGGYRQIADILDPTVVGGGASAADQQGHNGDINITAGGDIDFAAGQVDGEILPGQEAFGIEKNIQTSFTMVGHGGYESFGDHWGEINVTAGGDLKAAARGGWDGVSIEGNNIGPANPLGVNADQRGTPRLGVNEDDALNGFFNFAQIGHGGFNTAHRPTSVVQTQGGALLEVSGNQATDTYFTVNPHGFAVGQQVAFYNIAGGTGMANNTLYFVVATPTANSFQVSTTAGGAPLNFTANLQRQTSNSSGKLGEGLGTFGPSDITIDVGGDVRIEAAQKSTIGPTVRDVVTRDPIAANSTTPVVYRDVLGNIVPLSAVVSQFSGIPTIIDRAGTSGSEATDTFQIWQGTNVWDRATQAPPADGSVVRFTSLNGGTGLAVNTDYFVINSNAGANTFQLSTTAGGAAINFTTNLLGGNMTVNGIPVGGERWHMPAAVMSAQDSYAMIGHGGRSSDYTNGGVTSSLALKGDTMGHRGNISITAGGGVEVIATDIDLEVGLSQALNIDVDDGRDGTIDRVIRVGNATPFEERLGTVGGLSGTDTRSQLNFSFNSRNFAMIGNGGWTSRGDHQGNITINGGKTAGGVGLNLLAGEDAQSFAQIGMGGYDSDGFNSTGNLNSDNFRLNDTGSSGTLYVNVDGDVTLHGGGMNNHVAGKPGTVTANMGDGDQVVILNDGSSFSYAMLGNGGYANGGTQSGDITLVSNEGGVTVKGGKSARFSFAQIGNGGANTRGAEHNGNVSVVAHGDVIVEGGSPIRDSESSQGELDNPELANASHISHGVANYAQIGHGGWDSDPQGGNLNLQPGTGGFFGDIEVVSITGDVKVLGGGTADATSLSTNDDQVNRGNSAQIGNGGNFTDGDHRGDIRVAAGRDVIVMGAAGSRDGFTQIGHGGLNGGTAATESGNFSGDIEVVAGRDLFMNRGTDTDTGTGGQGLWAIRQHTAGTTTFALWRYSNTLENTAAFSIFPTVPTGVGQPAIPVGTQVTAAFPTGFQVGDKVRFTALTGGTGLAANTTYFVVSVSGNSFELSTTAGGAPIPFTSAITAASMQKLLDITASGATDRITAAGHTFVTGDRIRVTQDVGGLVTTTSYFVRDVVGDTFRISTAQGGAPLDIAADIASGTIARSSAEVVQVFRSTRDGNEVFNNYTKIGHGDHLYRQRGSGSGSAVRNGDIDISVGRDVALSDPANRPYVDEAYTRTNRDMILIGHIDPVNSGSSAFRSTVGHTYIAASRTDPYDTGTGKMSIHPDAVLTSAGAGFFGELRLYMPTPAQNDIRDGAFFNNADYTRTPTPDGTRADEVEATDHELTVGAFGEPDGQFVPEGAYSPSGFGLYTIYYGTTEPVVPPGPGPGPGGGGGGGFLPPTVPPVEPPVIPPFDYFPFIFTDKYDSFDRDEEMLGGDLLAGLFSIFGLDSNEAYEGDEGIRVEGDEILEESPGMFGLGPAQTESEEEEEEDKSGRYLKFTRSMYGQFWTYNIGTNEYSSYRVFGVPAVSRRR
ncbi:MAG: filamentous hemagglutinin N-terminal domain-containing protein [Verrucomicrobiales bacterium]|nr:filamentous hemagglutinin N-terminal domain-containing protein [Verrucomicrobiales bacterium]